MKIVALCRQKNGIKFLPRLVQQLDKIVDETVFLDDFSTDNSYDFLNNRAWKNKFHLIRRTPETKSADGGADWNVLYRYVREMKPDWIFCPDVDELIEEGSEQSVRRLCESSGVDTVGWSFPFYYLWNDEKHYRDDGPYFNTRVIRLFRYNSTLTPPTRATHSTCVPDQLDRRRIRVATIRMWHFGYMDPKDRALKYEYYKARDKDPNQAGAGSSNYDHMINEPSTLPTVPSAADWSFPLLSLGPTVGNFLQSRPRRITFGTPFPFTEEMSLDGFDQFFLQDEIRLGYVLDGLSTSKCYSVLTDVFQKLRPGGRLDLLATDFHNLCEAFTNAPTQQKFDLRERFILTPLRQAYQTIFFEEVANQMLTKVGFTDIQRISIPEMPVRLHMLAYKPGDPKWI